VNVAGEPTAKLLVRCAGAVDESALRAHFALFGALGHTRAEISILVLRGCDAGYPFRCAAVLNAGGAAILLEALRQEAGVSANAAAVLCILCAGDDEGCAGRRDAVLACGTAALVAALGRPETDLVANAAAVLCILCAGVDEDCAT
jgi:hypothetical protein